MACYESPWYTSSPFHPHLPHLVHTVSTISLYPLFLLLQFYSPAYSATIWPILHPFLQLSYTVPFWSLHFPLHSDNFPPNLICSKSVAIVTYSPAMSTVFLRRSFLPLVLSFQLRNLSHTYPSILSICPSCPACSLVSILSFLSHLSLWSGSFYLHSGYLSL